MDDSLRKQPFELMCMDTGPSPHASLPTWQLLVVTCLSAKLPRMIQPNPHESQPNPRVSPATQPLCLSYQIPFLVFPFDACHAQPMLPSPHAKIRTCTHQHPLSLCHSRSVAFLLACACACNFLPFAPASVTSLAVFCCPLPPQ